MHWRITGAPERTSEMTIVTVLATQMGIRGIVPTGPDPDGHMTMTVRFFTRPDDDLAAMGAQFTAASQALLRKRLHCPDLIIEDVTRRPT